MTIDELKSYLTTEDGGKFLLDCLRDAKFRQEKQFREDKRRENDAYWEKRGVGSFSSDKMRDNERKAWKDALETPKELQISWQDMTRAIKERGALLVNGTSVHLHTGGGTLPQLPVLQAPYFNSILETGEGICYDSRKQKYHVELVE